MKTFSENSIEPCLSCRILTPCMRGCHGDVRGCRGGVRGGGGHAWLLGGMHGYWGACMVAGEHAWLWGMYVVARGLGACVVARGGMHGCQGGVHGCGGVCGCGDVCGCQGGWGHAWLLGLHGCLGGMHKIRQDTVKERAVRILLECILVELSIHIFSRKIIFTKSSHCQKCGQQCFCVTCENFNYKSELQIPLLLQIFPHYFRKSSMPNLPTLCNYEEPQKYVLEWNCAGFSLWAVNTRWNKMHGTSKRTEVVISFLYTHSLLGEWYKICISQNWVGWVGFSRF